MASAADRQTEKMDLGPSAAPFSAFERMVAWRYLRSRRKEAFISVIAGFSF
ncbi:MAG: lipoprotein-releasing system transmembrane subunit LolC, partial [Pseudorhizobium sp.]